MTEIAVTDTHALIWYATGRAQRLGRKARRVFERADAGGGAVYVPVLSLVEVGDAAHRGLLRLGGGTLEWIKRLLASGRYLPAELNADVVALSEELRDIRERTDRLIAATALHLDLPLITRDHAIAKAGVSVIW
jgi:PIN domain nuclease of toxin-antitoxin system